MRIAFLTDYPRNIDSPLGGVEVVARSLALGLSTQPNVELHVLTFRKDVSRITHERQFDHVTVHYLPQLGRLELPTLFLQYRLLLARLLRNIQPDVVHANDLGPYPYAAGALGYRYALTVHGLQSTERLALGHGGLLGRARIRLLRHIEDTSVRKAAAIIANSTYVLRQVKAKPRQRIFSIPNPVDPQFFAPQPDMPRDGQITWVGVIMRRKAVDLLIKALHTVRRAVPQAHLRLIGPCSDTTYLRELQDLAAQLGLSGQVEFLGPRDAHALPAEYASASVVALSSLEENVPVTITGAMAVGRPVVATNVGGVAELVEDGTSGLLCIPNDVPALAAALCELLSDEPRRREMGRLGRIIGARRFSLDAVVARHLEVYEAITP